MMPAWGPAKEGNEMTENGIYWKDGQLIDIEDETHEYDYEQERWY